MELFSELERDTKHDCEIKIPVKGKEKIWIQLFGPSATKIYIPNNRISLHNTLSSNENMVHEKMRIHAATSASWDIGFTTKVKYIITWPKSYPSMHGNFISRELQTIKSTTRLKATKTNYLNLEWDNAPTPINVIYDNDGWINNFAEGIVWKIDQSISNERNPFVKFDVNIKKLLNARKYLKVRANSSLQTDSGDGMATKTSVISTWLIDMFQSRFERRSENNDEIPGNETLSPKQTIELVDTLLTRIEIETVSMNRVNHISKKSYLESKNSFKLPRIEPKYCDKEVGLKKKIISQSYFKYSKLPTRTGIWERISATSIHQQSEFEINQKIQKLGIEWQTELIQDLKKDSHPTYSQETVPIFQFASSLTSWDNSINKYLLLRIPTSIDQSETIPIQPSNSVKGSHSLSKVLDPNLTKTIPRVSQRKLRLILVSEEYIEHKAISYELSESYDIKLIDCPLSYPITFEISTSTSISIIDNSVVSDKEHFKTFMRHLVEQSSKWTCMYIVRIKNVKISAKQECCFFKSFSRFPIQIVIREAASIADISRLINKFCESTEESSKCDGSLESYNPLQGTSIAHGECLQLLPAINFSQAIKIMRRCKLQTFLTSKFDYDKTWKFSHFLDLNCGLDVNLSNS